MKTGNESGQAEKKIASLSRRTRQSSLLFNGDKLGTTLALAAFLEPKIPPFKGE
ncbi:MAG TPA: hypothetical protein VGS22_19285 [Thermoanaerobaculia bacterium]|jgi:hypothetical protein|nr:hypothetical protein [Thermoanaerobaculia bacterium]